MKPEMSADTGRKFFLVFSPSTTNMMPFGFWEVVQTLPNRLRVCFQVLEFIPLGIGRPAKTQPISLLLTLVITPTTNYYVFLYFYNSQVFQELNNFSGMMQVLSCLESAAINRLQHTFIVS